MDNSEKRSAHYLSIAFVVMMVLLPSLFAFLFTGLWVGVIVAGAISLGVIILPFVIELLILFTDIISESTAYGKVSGELYKKLEVKYFLEVFDLLKTIDEECGLSEAYLLLSAFKTICQAHGFEAELFIPKNLEERYMTRASNLSFVSTNIYSRVFLDCSYRDSIPPVCRKDSKNALFCNGDFSEASEDGCFVGYDSRGRKYKMARRKTATWLHWYRYDKITGEVRFDGLNDSPLVCAILKLARTLADKEMKARGFYRYSNPCRCFLTDENDMFADVEESSNYLSAADKAKYDWLNNKNENETKLKAKKSTFAKTKRVKKMQALIELLTLKDEDILADSAGELNSSSDDRCCPKKPYWLKTESVLNLLCDENILEGISNPVEDLIKIATRYRTVILQILKMLDDKRRLLMNRETYDAIIALYDYFDVEVLGVRVLDYLRDKYPQKGVITSSDWLQIIRGSKDSSLSTLGTITPWDLRYLEQRLNFDNNKAWVLINNLIEELTVRIVKAAFGYELTLSEERALEEMLMSNRVVEGVIYRR